MRKLWMLLWMLGSFAVAQNDTISLSSPLWATNRATSFGVGSASVYDSYLSTLEYKGNSYLFLFERLSRTHFFSNKLIKQQTFSLDLGLTENPARNNTTYSLMGEYKLGAHYPVWQYRNFRLRVGGLWNITAGTVYNERNSNNPALFRAYSNLNISGQLFYRWNSLLFRWQLDIPFAGAFFLPEYRASYYEVFSLGNRPNSVHFASFHNQRALASTLTMDFPLSSWTIRLGLNSSLYQTRENNVVSHLYRHNLMIGFVNESINLSGKRMKEVKISRSALEE